MTYTFTKLVSGMALGFAAMGFAGSAMAADPIKIGVTGPFTGGSSSMGVSMRDGVRLAGSAQDADRVDADLLGPFGVMAQPQERQP